jgi:lipoprotein-releasing system permease protein
MVMIISSGVLEGFKSKIREKIFSFGAHIQITKYDLKKSYEESPLHTNSNLYLYPDSVGGIAYIQSYSNKAALLRTEEDIMGVVLKGIGHDFRNESFKKNIIEGEFLELPDSGYSREVIVSRKIADRMNLAINDPVILIFSRTNYAAPTYRKLTVKGIYQTGLEEFDEHFIVGDIQLIRKINNWNDSLVGGYEIYVTDFSKLNQISESVFNYMDYDMQIEKITDKYIQIFDWLKLLDRNVVIFLVLILLVASFNMIATLLIMIMERTNMIGVLKALGANNQQVQYIFIYSGARILSIGMLLGNVLGIGVCLLQYWLKIIPLDAENYYMHYVPIKFNWAMIIGINMLTFLTVTIVLLIPTYIISRMNPVKSIKFS